MRVSISPGTISARTIADATSVFAALVALLAAPVAAQTGDAPKPAALSPAPETVTPVPNTQPDVQIVVLVLPTGAYAVSSVYPKQVPKAVAQGRIDRLLALTKWRATNRKFSDAPAVPNPLSDDATPKGNLSAASFETTGAVYGAADGTVDWEPFLRAFGDMSRINLVCFTGTDFAYRGPVRFESDRITFSAFAGEGTVAAVASLKKLEPSPPAFGLPRYTEQTVAAPRAGQVTRNGAGGQTRRIVGIALLILAATGVALVIYALTSRFVTRP